METTASVDTVMKAPVKTLPPETLAIDALQLAEKWGVHHFPLLDGDRLTGLVCTCDLDDIELQAPVGHAVQRPPATIRPQASIAEAVQIMSDEGVGSLLVTEGERLLGIVTREDLAAADVSWDDAPGFHCTSCGSVTHLRNEGTKGVLCLDCRLHAKRETPDDETSVGD